MSRFDSLWTTSSRPHAARPEHRHDRLPRHQRRGLGWDAGGSSPPIGSASKLVVRTTSVRHCSSGGPMLAVEGSRAPRSRTGRSRLSRYSALICGRMRVPRPVPSIRSEQESGGEAARAARLRPAGKRERTQAQHGLESVNHLGLLTRLASRSRCRRCGREQSRAWSVFRVSAVVP